MLTGHSLTFASPFLSSFQYATTGWETSLRLSQKFLDLGRVIVHCFETMPDGNDAGYLDGVVDGPNINQSARRSAWCERKIL